MQGQAILNLRLRRQTRVIVVSHGPMNIGFSWNEMYIVNEVKGDGIIGEHNASCAPSLQVQPGDTFCKFMLNGVEADLYHQVYDGDEVAFIFERPIIYQY